MTISPVGGGGLTTRRRFVQLTLAGLAGLAVSGHAPYGQWGVYRKRYLLILTTRADPASFELGRKVAAALLRELPESKAQVSRAPHKARIASLLSSHQLDLALMRPDDAAALREGLAPYADYGPMPLVTLLGIEDFLLVCRDDFAALHAWLIAEALSAAADGFTVKPDRLSPPAAPDPRLPLHPGVIAYFSGGAKPEAPSPSYAHDEEDARDP
ncbi:MAG: hypothetical protein ACT4SY_01430 [Hyphomicrobiales bacterium]